MKMVVLPTHVYVLGAGFSRAAGGPLLREFLDQGNQENSRGVGNLWRTAEFAALSELLTTLPTPEQNVEGLFNALGSKEIYGGRIGRFGPKTLKDFLVKYVAVLIRARVSQDFERLEVYEAFVDGALDDDEYAIITFNYDLVADQLVVEHRGALHYGFPSTPRYRYNRLRRARRRPYVLKLHGSLNWLICSVCKRIWLNDRYSDDKHGRTCFRPSCNGRLRLLIVPPMWNKEPVAKEIGLLWEQARTLLEYAEEINVIGFSFPSADRLATDMFREALSSNTNARFGVYNGPHFDYDRLGTVLRTTIAKSEDGLEGFVGVA